MLWKEKRRVSPDKVEHEHPTVLGSGHRAHEATKNPLRLDAYMPGPGAAYVAAVEVAAVAVGARRADRQRSSRHFGQRRRDRRPPTRIMRSPEFSAKHLSADARRSTTQDEHVDGDSQTTTTRLGEKSGDTITHATQDGGKKKSDPQCGDSS